ncbi:carbohydrate ABC transporter permease [Pseudotabrizicola algicola]|uniref:sn-glycerol-3-phosphate transport system permease protein UgpE n=1 Tax=Pseudotabrizicola algicola TaxID=2709381 RepID=A0A6B3S0A1_9RHOB|nr:carbohydrate ABC transporter permease [Pseudotabrizicola algicola]NEX48812.1 carbohydrate ABC transporter permease [Pseudotabrizicola algicola]
MTTRRFSFRPLAAAACGLLFFLPIWWVAVGALRPREDIFRYLSPLSWRTLWPTDTTIANIVMLFQSDFTRALFNSVFVTVVAVAFGLILCAMAGFALAVMRFRGREFVFFLIVVSFLIPFDAIALPLFGLMLDAGLQNTYIGLILPGIGNGLAVFLYRQFFLGIPKELREAGVVDGMSTFGIFWRIYLPLSRPAHITAGLILFLFQWQAYLWPLLIAPDTKYKVAAVAIAQFTDNVEGTQYNLIFTAAFFIALIPMIIITYFQKYFTSSVASMGGKG